MSSARNAPCPCGSGRKYKVCCGSQSGSAWELDVVPVRSPADTPDQRMGVLLVTAGSRALAAEALLPLPSDLPALAWTIAFHIGALGARKGKPSELRVRQPDLGAALVSQEQLTGIAVRVVADLPGLDAAAADLMATLGLSPAASRTGGATTWKAWGLSAELVRELFAAAAAFYRSAPWRAIGDDQPLFVDLPAANWAASVMGSGGEEYGLAVFTDPRDYLAMYDEELAPLAAAAVAQPMFSLLFAPADELDAVARKEVLAHGWEVAGPQAYPQLLTLNTPMGGISEPQAQVIAALLRQVPRFVKQHRELFESGERPLRQLSWDTGDRGVTLHYEGPVGDAALPPLSIEPVTRLAPALPRGPGARPEEALTSGGTVDRLADDLAIVVSFGRQLQAAGRSKTTHARHGQNATRFTNFLCSAHASLASATEFDLRVFLYGWAPGEMGDAANGVPASLVRFFDYLDREAGIAYPWAGALLGDRDALRGRVISFDASQEWGGDVAAWHDVLTTHLDDRVMLPNTGLDGGVAWGDDPQARETELWHELQRRWLVWRDEVIGGGTVEPAAVREELERRQLAWETAPHAGCGWRTPAQALEAERGETRR